MIRTLQVTLISNAGPEIKEDRYQRIQKCVVLSGADAIPPATKYITMFVGGEYLGHVMWL